MLQTLALSLRIGQRLPPNRGGWGSGFPSDLHYWQGMRQALETAGDIQTAIYKRAVLITEQHVDPLDIEGASS